MVGMNDVATDRIADDSRRLIRRREVQELVGNPSRTTLWRWCRDGNFPRPIRLSSSGFLVWKLADVLAWMDEREQAS